MRMRHKKWSMPELLGSGYYVEEPEALRGKWKEAFARSQPLHLELGCRKRGVHRRDSRFYFRRSIISPSISAPMFWG